jgi:hypothetical protein
MTAINNALRAMPEFKATAGSDFIAINSHYRTPAVLPKVGATLKRGFVTSSDLSFLRLTPRLVENVIVVPYKPHFLLERSAAGERGAPVRTAPGAPITTHMFHGNMARHNGGRYRPVVAAMAKAVWKDADVADTDYLKWPSIGNGW